MGPKKSNNYIQSRGITLLDFLPELSYSTGEFKAVPRKHTDDFFLLFLPRERELEAYLKINERETFVDVGANVGSYSLRIGRSHAHKGVNVIAIEAHPNNYRALCRNIVANGLSNIKPINLAVSNYKGTIKIYEHVITDEHRDQHSKVQSGHSSIQKTFDKDYFSEIQCDTLDDILKDIRPDVMKIDIEGAEVQALRAATISLKKTRRIIVEIHDDNLDAVRQILQDSGFELNEIDGTDGMKHVVGTRETKKQADI